MPPLRGRMRRRCCHFSDTTLFKQSGVPWVPFTNCQKKAEVPPSAQTTHCPFTEEASEGLSGVHLLVVAIATKRLLGSATQEKAEVPPSACVRRIHLLRMMLFYVRSVTTPSTIGRTAH